MSVVVVMKRYCAFISYNQKDQKWATLVQKTIENYKLQPRDAEIAELTSFQRFIHPIKRIVLPSTTDEREREVFVDRSELSIGNLRQLLFKALDCSDALIVLCSPNVMKSSFVEKEIRYFKARYPERPVIPLIVHGHPDAPVTDFLPRPINRRISKCMAIGPVVDEDVIADARHGKDGKDLALSKVLAKILNLQTDDVHRRWLRDKQERWRRIMRVTALVITLAGAASFGAWTSWELMGTNRKVLYSTLEQSQRLVDLAIVDSDKHKMDRGVSTKLLNRSEVLFDEMHELGWPTPMLAYRQAQMKNLLSRNYYWLDEFAQAELRARTSLAAIEAGAEPLWWHLFLSPNDKPDAQDWVAISAEVHMRLADVLLGRNDSKAAAGHVAKAHKLWRELVKAEPDNPKYRRGLASTYLKRGIFRLDTGNYKSVIQDKKLGFDLLHQDNPIAKDAELADLVLKIKLQDLG